MGLVASQEHILGERSRLFVVEESNPGSYETIAATDAMAALTVSMSPKIARKDRLDAYQADRDVKERITGKSEYKWAIDGYYVPSGTKNVPPNCGPLLKCLLGAEATNANDVIYSQASSQVLTLATIVSQRMTWFQEFMYGAWVDSCTLKASGGDEPKIHFEGGAQRYVETGHSLTTEILAGAEVDVTYTPADDSMFEVGSIVDIGTSTGHTISAVDTTGHEITFAPAVSAQASGVAIIPNIPTWTDAGVPTTGISGSLTWDSLPVSAAVTGFEVTINGGLNPHGDTAFSQHVVDVVPGFFDISGKLDMRIRKDHLIKVLNRKDFSSVAIALVLGGAAQSGTRAEIGIAFAELDYSDVVVPEMGEATVSLPFKALGSSGNDAITWKHT